MKFLVCVVLVLLFACLTEGQWMHKEETTKPPPTTRAPTTKPPTTKPLLVCPENDDSCIPPELLEKLHRIGDNITMLAEEFGFKNIREKATTHTSDLTCDNTQKTYVVPVDPHSHVLGTSSDEERNYDISTNSVEVKTDADLTCRPRYQVVVLRKPAGIASLWPPCRKLKRCGGCCEAMAHAMECVPKLMSTETIGVFALKRDFSMLVYPVQVTQHEQCECVCKKKAEHCSPAQIYVAHDCQCMCPRAQTQCSQDKIWSWQACACVCERKRECASRHVWHEDKCECDCSKEDCRVGETRDWDSCLCVATVQSGK